MMIVETLVFVASFALGVVTGVVGSSAVAAKRRRRAMRLLERAVSALDRDIDSSLAEAQSMYADWLEARPKSIAELGKHYPPGQIKYVDGKKHFVVGFEDDEPPKVILSPISPFEDYHAAIKCSDSLYMTHEELKNAGH